MLQDRKCNVLITRPTRKSAILDHIYTNKRYWLENLKPGIIKTDNISDHYPVYCLIDYSIETCWHERQSVSPANPYSKLQLQLPGNLKEFGLPFIPIIDNEIDPCIFYWFFFNAKQLSPLNFFQMKELTLNEENKKVHKCAPFDGYDDVVFVFGYEISNTEAEKIFRDAKQSYIIPVYLFLHSRNYSDKNNATGSTVATAVSNTRLEDDAEDIFVPTECVVIHSGANSFNPMDFVRRVCEP